MLRSARAQRKTLRWCTIACLVLLSGLPGIAAAAHSTKTTPGQSLQQQNQTLAVSHGVASPPQQQDTNSSSISTTGASGDAGGMQQPVAGDQQQVPADSIHGSSVTLGSSSGGSEEVGEANLEGGPGHVDTIGAEVAARPADDLPSKYPVKGLIDVQAPIFSEQPGVLIPLAQVRSGIGDWLAALEAASSGTPLSDPMFVGTVFIPANEAFERVFPTLHKLQQQGKAAFEVFANVSASGLALQLNSLTVPGPTLTYEQLWPGRVLKTAGVGSLKVVRAGTPEVAAMLQHVPSGVTFSVVEPDVQSGSAVGHIVDTLPSEEEVSQEAKPAVQRAAQGAYRSAVRLLADPALQLGSFAWFVQQAGLGELLSSSSDAFTLLVPHDKAFKTFISGLTSDVRRKLLVNASLADQLVSAHLVPGIALGSAALEALLPSGQLKTPQGSVAVLPAAREATDLKPSSRTEAVTEAGQLKTAARLESAAVGAGTAVGRAAATAAGDVRELAAVPGQQTAAIVAADAPSSGSHPQVADAHIEVADLVAGKAVVHVLGKVLVPPGLEQVLGVPASSGYVCTLTPAPLASSASGAGAATGAWRAAATAAAAAIVALLA